MKKVLLVLIVSLPYFKAFSHCFCGNTIGSFGPYLIDSCDFDTSNTNNLFFEVDTTLPNNLWQVGTVTKLGFPMANFGNRAIQTDTVNTYDTNNISAFNIWTNSIYYVPTQDSVFSINFWHYYNVDSLQDTCMVQYTLDSGLTWLNYTDTFFF